MSTATDDHDRRASLQRLVRVDVMVALAALAVIVIVTALDHASRSQLWNLALLG
jgi:hypothetical protein